MEPSRRAEYANQILKNPIFPEVFEILKVYYVDRMISTDTHDLATREHFHKSIRILADVKSSLTACVEKGKIEKVKAARKEKGNK